MQFKEGTTVYTADGEKVGDIERFVVDPRERKVVGLVVRKGFLFTEDKVVPIELVTSATEERVVLRPHTGDLPPYIQRHYVAPNESEVDTEYEGDYIEPIYYYPPPDIAVWYPGVYATPGVIVEERNIPQDSVPMKKGADVISRDGEDVGDVERVITDSRTGRITHFSVKQGVLFQKERLIPAGWVDQMDEDEVHLAVSSQTLERLHDL
ncbi:MAG: PRC-barrel domain-containing protein [Chloroflexi bacterium]|nr:PRC-barrel domain-containing protein [Chloroflexota bacterium]